MNIRMLIVDDEIPQLNLIGRVIRRYRPTWQITLSASAEEALDLLRDGDFNALMTDIKMPGMDGVALIQAARETGIAPLEIVILSGYADFQYAKSAISFDVLEYLLKPVDATSLRDVMRKLETKLDEDYSRIHLRSDYDVLRVEQTASALYKLALGTELSVREAILAENAGERFRLVFAERPSAGFAFGLCVQEGVSPGRTLYFAPDAPEWRAPELQAARVVISMPARREELAQRYLELCALWENAEALQLARIEQRPADPSVMNSLLRAIQQREAASVRSMIPLLDYELRAGGLSLSTLRSEILHAIESLSEKGDLQSLSLKRREDLMRALSEQLSHGRSAEALCQAVVDVFMPASGDDDFERNVQIFINAHYGSECMLNDIAKAFHYSTAHFSRLFLGAFHTSYSRYLTDYRLERARDLLLNTGLTVQQIASSVGFSDPDYMTRLFSKKYQMTPGKYRRQGG